MIFVSKRRWYLFWRWRAWEFHLRIDGNWSLFSDWRRPWRFSRLTTDHGRVVRIQLGPLVCHRGIAFCVWDFRTDLCRNWTATYDAH
jgi:hypothetical protein